MHSFDSIVFIVNADADCRSLLTHAVSTAGFNVAAFASASEYLSYSKPDLPSCHVLDVDLPDMSGLALQTLIAADGPILFATRQADVLASVRAFKAGAIDFLTLPFDAAQLLHAIRFALDRAGSSRMQQQRIAALRQRWNSLSRREREVLQSIVSGCLNKQVAMDLGISEITVKAHRGRVMAKMLARSFADLVRMATLLGVPLTVRRHGADDAVFTDLKVWFDDHQAAVLRRRGAPDVRAAVRC